MKKHVLLWDRGLSLLELIIILVVVGLLAAVLVPVLSQPTVCTRKGKCLSNLKECAIALQMYTHDHDHHMPSSVLVTHSRTWNRADYVRFATTQGTLPPKGQRVTWPQLLHPYTRNSDQIFCPDDPTRRPRSPSKVSYYWKLAIDKAWYGQGCRKRCRTDRDFAYPSRQIFLYERFGFHDDSPDGLKNGVEFNMACLDGHVMSKKLVNGPKLATFDPTAPGEPANFNMRGKGGARRPAGNVRPTYIDPSRYCDYLL